MNKTKRVVGILGIVLVALSLFLSANIENNFRDKNLSFNGFTKMSLANAEVKIGSNECVCKLNNKNRCLASNFISFRIRCGSGSNDSECEAQQPWYNIPNPTSYCEIHNV